jgi:CheY-like chemotaxis protein
MKKTGPILIVEDDADDRELIQEIISDLHIPNKTIFAGNGAEALNLLNKTDMQPFLVLSDINMPKMDGLDFKMNINARPDLKQRCFPFIFITTRTSRTLIARSDLLDIQGLFVKPHDLIAWRDILSTITNYWMKVDMPAKH